MSREYTLYLCTNTEMIEGKDIKECVEEAILGGVSIVQVREKNKTYEEFVEIAKEVQKVTNKYKVPLIINDRIDIAREINADGVHLGQEDIPCELARKILGKDKIIGISVTTLEEAIAAYNASADYIGVGAMFKSKTKKDAKVVDFDEFLKIQSKIKIPIVVIGGINEKTIPIFKNLNVSGYAMIRPILKQERIKEAATNLLNIILQNKT